MRWQIQEAKQRFSELINRAERDGPQVVTRHGAEVAVVIGAQEFHRLSKDKGAVKERLLYKSYAAYVLHSVSFRGCRIMHKL